MEKIDKILSHRLAQKGLSGAAEGAHICFLVGKWGKSHCNPISFSNGVLKVSVSSSTAASELQINAEDLIDFINKKIGKKAVVRLRIINQS